VEPTVILGTGPSTAELAETLRAHPEYGLYPVGALDRRVEETKDVPRLGDLSDLVDVVGRLRIRRIIITHPSTPEHDLIPVLRACDSLPVEVHVLPRLYELGVAPSGPTTDDVWGIPLVRLRRAALRTAAWRSKRLLDVVAGGLLLVLASPVFAAAALGVRLSGSGPVFFRQSRVGQRGELFELLKFRTLRVNDDSDTTWSAHSDPRQTRVGTLLRKTGLDELPQLLNVLAGSMSLVGPRPERPHYVDRFRVAVPRYDDRHRVPAGMTGWAQVHGLRGDTSIEDRAVFDNYYIENWSFWHDLVILARTFGTVLRGEGG
jgi:exopolysaccharide biosynthesis polyprenyl glycosylphosphotransferase